MGFSRQEHWSGLPFPSPGDLPDPGIEPRSPTLKADALTFEPPGFSDIKMMSIFFNQFYCGPVLLFSSISFQWSLRKAFLSLLAILWNSAFRCIYLSFSPLPLASLLFSAICKASANNSFAFLHFLFLGMVLITASYTMSWTSIHSSSGTLSIKSGRDSWW